MRDHPFFAHFSTPGLRGFTWVALGFWVFWLILVLVFGYEGSFLLLNGWNTPWLDQVMPHLTHLADGAILGGLVVALLARKHISPAIALTLSLLALPFFISALKMGVFADWSRPPVVFEGKTPFHYITVMKERQFSFPSGHSATAFLVLTYAALVVKRTWQGLLLGLLAVLLAWTRVYIGVHFVGDILAGGVLGFVLALGMWQITGNGFANRVLVWSSKTVNVWSWSLMLIGAIFFILEATNLYFTYYHA